MLGGEGGSPFLLRIRRLGVRVPSGAPVEQQERTGPVACDRPCAHPVTPTSLGSCSRAAGRHRPGQSAMPLARHVAASFLGPGPVLADRPHRSPGGHQEDSQRPDGIKFVVRYGARSSHRGKLKGLRLPDEEIETVVCLGSRQRTDVSAIMMVCRNVRYRGLVRRSSVFFPVRPTSCCTGICTTGAITRRRCARFVPSSPSDWVKRPRRLTGVSGTSGTTSMCGQCCLGASTATS